MSTFAIRRWSLVTASMTMLFTGCSEKEGPTEPELPAGVYTASVFTIRTAGELPVNVAAYGGVLQIALNANGSTSGSLVLPAQLGGTGTSISMVGTAALVDGKVVFSQDADTFVRNIKWSVFGSSLKSDNQLVNGKFYEITLTK